MATYTVHHTHLTTAAPDRSVSFYTTVMGGKLVREAVLGGGARAWDIDLGGLLLRISHVTGADEALKGEYDTAEGMHRYGLHHLALSVDNLDQAYQELSANGAEFVLPPTGPLPESGLRIAFVRAPENVLFELIEGE